MNATQRSRNQRSADFSPLRAGNTKGAGNDLAAGGHWAACCGMNSALRNSSRHATKSTHGNPAFQFYPHLSFPAALTCISHRIGARLCRRPAAACPPRAAADASRTAALRRSVSNSSAGQDACRYGKHGISLVAGLPRCVNWPLCRRLNNSFCFLTLGRSSSGWAATSSSNCRNAPVSIS